MAKRQKKFDPSGFAVTSEAKKIRATARAFGEALGDLMVAAIPAIGRAEFALAQVRQLGPLSTALLDELLADVDGALAMPCLRDLEQLAPPMCALIVKPLQQARAELIARKEAC